MLKGKDNITSFFSPNVKNICWRSSLTWALVCLSWSIMWDWAFPIPCLTRKTYLHVDCTWLYLNTSLTPPLVPRSLEKGGAAESFPGTAVNMSTCKSAVIIYLHIMKRMITTTLILLINHVFNFPPTAAASLTKLGPFLIYKMHPRRRPLSGPKQSSSQQTRFKSTNFSTQGSSRVAPVPSTLPGWHWWIARDQNEVPGCSPQIGCLPGGPGANHLHVMGIQMHNKTCE